MSVVELRSMTAPPPCAVCGTAVREAVRGRAEAAGLLGCARCGVWSVDPPPSLSSLRPRYDAAYYAPWRREAGARSRLWRRRLRRLGAVRRGRLLDVGCAEGAFLGLAREAGFEIAGTELSPDGAREASRRLGIAVHCGQLEHARLPGGSFAAVTLWHVLEHVIEPGRLLEEVRRILEPDGLLVVAVPNRRCLVFGAAYRIARGRRLRLHHPEDREQHLHHWEPKALRAALEHHGFELLDLRPDPCALGGVKTAIDLVGRVHSVIAGEPRTAAMLALARPAGGPP